MRGPARGERLVQQADRAFPLKMLVVRHQLGLQGHGAVLLEPSVQRRVPAAAPVTLPDLRRPGRSGQGGRGRRAPRERDGARRAVEDRLRAELGPAAGWRTHEQAAGGADAALQRRGLVLRAQGAAPARQRPHARGAGGAVHPHGARVVLLDRAPERGTDRADLPRGGPLPPPAGGQGRPRVRTAGTGPAVLGPPARGFPAFCPRLLR
mmetsp:Transcript_36611/g.97105  ORF Transcript_36611/g.97105 Transcript_36611/m.97105 type:complete len:208 (-) Transcript_36611:47-670(-)